MSIESKLDKLSTELNTILKALVTDKKEEVTVRKPRPKEPYQYVDRYKDKTLVYKDVYKRNTGYSSGFIKVGFLKEDNVIVFNIPKIKMSELIEHPEWYNNGFYTLELEGNYLRFTELDNFVLKDATEIFNKNLNDPTGYVTNDGEVFYYDQYLGE